VTDCDQFNPFKMILVGKNGALWSFVGVFHDVHKSSIQKHKVKVVGNSLEKWRKGGLAPPSHLVLTPYLSTLYVICRLFTGKREW